jgi:hypothetical protein
MTRTTNARIAGVTFLVYIAGGMASVLLFSAATSGEEIAAKLAGIAQHTTSVRIVVLLGLVQCFSALVLGVTLYAITRDQDPDIAMLALICRVVEGTIVGLSPLTTLALLWLATATGNGAPDPATAHALAAYLFLDGVALTATFFAVGSTLFAYLLLRGRMIPAWLAWLGVISSALLVVALPLQLAGFLGGPIATLVWLPGLAFEVIVAFWLILKGVAGPTRSRPGEFDALPHA